MTETAELLGRPLNMGLSIADRRKQERWMWRVAIMVSALLHALVLLLFPTQRIPLEFAGGGGLRGDFGGGGGGGNSAVQVVNLTSPAPSAAPTVPEVEVVPVPVVEVPPTPREMPALNPVPVPPAVFGTGPDGVGSGAGAGAGSGSGSGAGSGSGTGQGSGTGSGSGSGTGSGSLVPPSPRGMIIPPSNRSLRGQQVEVWVFVDERGRVVADSTYLEKPTSDEGFNRRLIREAAEWVFQPARLAGNPVATWFPYRISM